MLLSYEKLLGSLEAYGFKINPYNLCGANNVVVGKQLTVCCYVFNLKISCVDRHEVSKMILWLESEYDEMRGSSGNRHD